MKKSLQAVLDRLQRDQREFSMSELTSASGLSRQAIGKTLRRLIMAQRLSVRGVNRHARYVFKKHASLDEFQAAKQYDFWSELDRKYSGIRIISLAMVLNSEPRRKAQTENLFCSLEHVPFVVFDFKHVARVNSVFVRTLLMLSRERSFSYWTVNAAPAILKVFTQEDWWLTHKPVSD